MTNVERVSAALSEWAFNIAKSALPKIKISPNSPIGHLMGIVGADPAKYNIWNELGFLAEPLLQSVVTPMASKALAGMPEEQIPELAQKFVDAFIEQAKAKGSVNVFGIELGENAFQGLKEILERRLEE